jgi:hypothetical protein
MTSAPVQQILLEPPRERPERDEERGSIERRARVRLPLHRERV